MWLEPSIPDFTGLSFTMTVMPLVINKPSGLPVMPGWLSWNTPCRRLLVQRCRDAGEARVPRPGVHRLGRFTLWSSGARARGRGETRAPSCPRSSGRGRAAARESVRPPGAPSEGFGTWGGVVRVDTDVELNGPTTPLRSGQCGGRSLQQLLSVRRR